VKLLKTALDSGVQDLIRLKVFFSEGLLVGSLANPADGDSKNCIRAELSSIAGNIIPRESVQITLLSAAEKLIG